MSFLALLRCFSRNSRPSRAWSEALGKLAFLGGVGRKFGAVACTLGLITAQIAGLAALAPSAGAATDSVISLRPNTGPLSGGTAVTITGTGFTGATAVTFGGVSASFNVVSDSSITATAPAGNTGPQDVVVTGASGTSAVGPQDKFTYGSYDHVFTILMENEGDSNLVGDSSAPYLNGLVNRYGDANNYFAITHPSLPNYLAVTAGTDFGVGSDCQPSQCSQSGPNIAGDRLDPAGLSWKSYQESMPSACYKNDSGEYIAHHDPFVYYSDISASECASKVVNYSQLSGDLASAATTPNYAWITPNGCDDMHDTCSGNPIAQGDTWLSSQVPQILNSPAFTQQRSVLFITWDEDEDNGGNNQVLSLVIANNVSNHIVSNAKYTHYSLLRTVESIWGLSPMASGDSAATPMSDLLGSGSPPPPVPSPSASPTPRTSPQPSPSASPTPRASASPTPRPSPTRTPRPSPTPTNSPLPSPSLSPRPSPSRSPRPSPSPSRSRRPRRGRRQSSSGSHNAVADTSSSPSVDASPSPLSPLTATGPSSDESPTPTGSLNPSPTTSTSPSPTTSTSPSATDTPSPSTSPSANPSPSESPTAGTSPGSDSPSGPEGLATASGTPLVKDSFGGRTIIGGWGTSSDGNSWTVQAGDPAVLSVSDGEGRVAGSSTMQRLDTTLGSQTAVNSDVVARYTSKDYGNDTGRLMVRFSGKSTYYAAGLASAQGSPVIDIVRDGGIGESEVASVAYDATDATSYWERVQVQNSGNSSTITVRVWPDGTPEPATWNLTYVDASPLAAGKAGVQARDSGEGWAMDNFSAASLSAPDKSVSPALSGSSSPEAGPSPAADVDETPSAPSPSASPSRAGIPTASGALIDQDGFTGQTRNDGWGASPDGNGWSVVGGNPGSMSVSGSQARLNGSSGMAPVKAVLGAKTAGDSEAVARYTSQDYANDTGHLMLRFSSPSSYYVAGLDAPNGSSVLDIMRDSGQGDVKVASVPFAAVDGTSYWERVRVEGAGSSATISVRAWPDGTPEPSTWNLTYSDASPLPAGRVGIQAWDGGSGWTLDSFSAGNLGSGSQASFLGKVPGLDLALMILGWLVAMAYVLLPKAGLRREEADRAHTL